MTSECVTTSEDLPFMEPSPLNPDPSLRHLRHMSMAAARNSYRKTVFKTARSMLFMFAFFAVVVEGKTKNRKKRKSSSKFRNMDAQSRMYSTFRLIRNTYMLVLVPVIVYFLYSLYTDPAVPQIARALWRIGKKKLMGHLGKGEEEDLEGRGKKGR